MGMARASDASCAWFSETLPEESAGIFYYRDEDWHKQNSYPKHVTIVNEYHYCGLNEVKFEKRCDGYVI